MVYLPEVCAKEAGPVTFRKETTMQTSTAIHHAKMSNLRSTTNASSTRTSFTQDSRLPQDTWQPSSGYTPTLPSLQSGKVKSASPTKRFLLGAAAGAATAAAGCLVLAGTLSPFGAVIVLSSAVIGGVVGRDGADADFSHATERLLRPEPDLFPYL